VTVSNDVKDKDAKANAELLECFGSYEASLIKEGFTVELEGSKSKSIIITYVKDSEHKFNCIIEQADYRHDRFKSLYSIRISDKVIESDDIYYIDEFNNFDDIFTKLMAETEAFIQCKELSLIHYYYHRYMRTRILSFVNLKKYQIKNTAINQVFTELCENFNKYATNSISDYEEYKEKLDQVLYYLSDFNNWIKNALSINENIDEWFKNNPGKKQYEEEYLDFWKHQKYSFENYLELTINFPNNIESLEPDIVNYLNCEYADSKLLNWSLINIIAFKELKSHCSIISMQIALTKPGFWGSIFNKKRIIAIEKVMNLLRKFHSIYHQCDKHMFNPRVLNEVLIDIRKEGDYYDGVIFEIIQKMIDEKQFHIS
jgi:hypothetical protein